MKLGALFILTAGLLTAARASTITVEVTGITNGVRIGEGPIFDFNSYQKIPDGTPFILTYTFDDTKGKESLSQVIDGVITQSEIEATASSSPGTNATLQIGNAMWEFGASTDSQAKLNTSSGTRSYQFIFSTPEKSNRVSTNIFPANGGYWPKTGDWRASFTANSLRGSTGSFSADNGRVDAKGNLIPSMITVMGVNPGGQWLSYTTIAGGLDTPDWKRRWQLAQASPGGGYVVQEVIRDITGTKPDGSPLPPSSVKYWEAWQVPAGSRVTVSIVDNSTNAAPAGSNEDDSVSTTARFYEGLTLPSIFAAGNSPYAGSNLSSITDPNLPTDFATLPVVLTRHTTFGRSR